MSIEEVRSLVGERQRYDDWLSALEAKRSETPERVFARVRVDYLQRRTGVMEQLREHIDVLSTLAEQLDTRLGELESRLATLEDERAEAMLRTAVGEYDGERWETVRQEVERNLAVLLQERDALRTEVDEVRALLANARSEPRSVPEVAVSDTKEEAPLPPEPTSQADGVETSAPMMIGSPGLATSNDTPDVPAPVDLDSEDMSGVGMAGSAPAIASPAWEEFPVSDSPQGGDDFDDALAMFADTPGTADPVFTHSLEGIEVERDDEHEPFRPMPVAPPVTTATVTPVVDNETFDDLAFLRSVVELDSPPASASAPPPAAASSPEAAAVAPTAAPSTGENTKTLVCTECGTMNLPTEWYCERCGGELAAF